MSVKKVLEIGLDGAMVWFQETTDDRLEHNHSMTYEMAGTLKGTHRLATKQETQS